MAIPFFYMFDNTLSTRSEGETTGFTKTVNTVEAGDVITVSELKQWGRIDYDDDDALLQTLIDGAVDMTERYLYQTLKQKTYTFEYQGYGVEIPLPYGPHVSVDEVRRKQQGDEEVLTTDDYFVTGQDFKTLNLYQSFSYQQLEVDVTAGYGLANIPSQIKIAMLKIALSHYEDRQDILSGTIVAELPDSSRNILNKYKRYVI